MSVLNLNFKFVLEKNLDNSCANEIEKIRCILEFRQVVVKINLPGTFAKLFHLSDCWGDLQASHEHLD